MKRTLYPSLLFAVVLAALLAAPVHAQGDGTYVVQSGDTLTYIAARYGLTATQLAAANGLSWDAWVYAGQRLRIPGGGMIPAPTDGTTPGAGGTYVVQRGDSMTAIARRYGLTVDQLAAANGLGHNAWVYAGQQLKIPGLSQTTGPSQQGASEGGMTPAPTAATVDAVGAYVVRPGDTLLRIAMRHGLTVQRLAMANGMYINSWVYIGQRLRIPGTQSSPTSDVSATAPQPEPDAGAPPAEAAGGTYAVRPGDSLIDIAVRHGVSVSQLAVANGLNSTAWVYVGQRLQIPGPGSAQASPPSAPQPQPAPQPAAQQPANPQPTNSQPATGTKWIDINLTAQSLTAYVGDQAVLYTKVSTGTRYTPTVVGTFRVYSKYLSTNMSGPGYSVPNVPHVMFFYGGYSIHGTYWHSNFGTPMSHGCVNLPLAEAKWLFEWAPVGTKVATHY